MSVPRHRRTEPAARTRRAGHRDPTDSEHRSVAIEPVDRTRRGRYGPRSAEPASADSPGASRRTKVVATVLAGLGVVAALALVVPRWLDGSDDAVTTSDVLRTDDPVPTTSSPTPTATTTAPAAAMPSQTATATPTPTASAAPSPTRTRTATPSPPAAEPAPSPPAAEPPPPSPSPSSTVSSSGADAFEAEVLALVNTARAAAGCPALQHDGPLTALARAFSADMAARGFFSHTDPDGRDPWDRAADAGIANLRAENIARGQATPTAVMDSWMGSAGHKANILNCSYRTLGVGVHMAPGGPWWTQDFGS